MDTRWLGHCPEFSATNLLSADFLRCKLQHLMSGAHRKEKTTSRPIGVSAQGPQSAHPGTPWGLEGFLGVVTPDIWVLKNAQKLASRVKVE